MNKYSGALAFLFAIMIEYSSVDLKREIHYRMGKLNLIDLAGFKDYQKQMQQDKDLKKLNLLIFLFIC